MLHIFQKLSQIESLKKSEREHLWMSGRYPTMSMEKIRKRYNKLIEEGKFRVWEAEDPMFKIQQYLLERK